MCNEAARRIALDQLRVDWSELRIPLRFPEGAPNFQPTDSIRITDPAPIIRLAAAAPDAAAPPAAEMVTRRWSWPGPTGKPVYNYRSDGRELRHSGASSGSPQSTTLRGGQGRCLVPIDGFYEFTDAEASPSPSGEGAGGWGVSAGGGASPVDRPHPNPSPEGEGLKTHKGKRPPKAKWEFRVRGLDWFCVAGLWRTDPKVGEAWTMLTTEPGPDIAPYHSRQIVILTPPDYVRWLDGSAPAAELCRPLPAGTLDVIRVR